MIKLSTENGSLDLSGFCWLCCAVGQCFNLRFMYLILMYINISFEMLMVKVSLGCIVYVCIFIYVYIYICGYCYRVLSCVNKELGNDDPALRVHH